MSESDQLAPALADRRWVLFGGQPAPEPGTAEDHAFFDPLRKLFARDIDEVKTDFQKVADQVDALVGTLRSTAGGFALDEVSVELGFSATGRLVFIAEAGVTATISVTYRRVDTD